MSEEQGEYITTGNNEMPESKSGGEDYYTTGSISAQGKPIRCPECRQVIGHVIRRGGVRTFRLEVGGFAVETAFDAQIWCCCGGLLVWHAGQEALDELLGRMLNRDGQDKQDIK